MQQVSLSPTDAAALEFTGDLLVGLEGNDQDGRTGGRWHDINIYSTDTGSLATCVTYRTTVSTEIGHCYVDMAQDSSEVDALLSLYDPKERIVLESGCDRNRVVEAVVRRYDLQVLEVLDRLQSLPAEDPPAKPR